MLCSLDFFRVTTKKYFSAMHFDLELNLGKHTLPLPKTLIARNVRLELCVLNKATLTKHSEKDYK